MSSDLWVCGGDTQSQAQTVGFEWLLAKSEMSGKEMGLGFSSGKIKYDMELG